MVCFGNQTFTMIIIIMLRLTYDEVMVISHTCEQKVVWICKIHHTPAEIVDRAATLSNASKIVGRVANPSITSMVLRRVHQTPQT